MVDGGILTFIDDTLNPKWSYAKIDTSSGYVEEVREKHAISNLATVGIYWFNKGSDFIKYAEQMIKQNIKTNGEFYLVPVYNLFIQDGKKIKTFNCDKMYGLGTPEDLKLYLRKY
jgi:dTDP-glucose pyrophosphorylase